MKEQFDKKLVEKIKDSFQNHEEPFNPQEWEKLSHAYFKNPVKKRNFAYWPFFASGIAATLLLLLVFWPFGEDLKKNVQTITDSISIDSKQFGKIEIPSKNDRLAVKEEKKENLLKKEITPFKSPAKNPVQVTRTTAIPLSEIYPRSQEISPSLKEMAADLEQARKLREDIQKNAANERVGNLTIAQNDPGKAQEWVDQWKTGGKSSGEDSMNGNSNRFRLGLLVGPQTSSNPVSGMSLGGGVVSEFSFSNRLKLDVGVTYARHSVEPENNQSLPQNATLSTLSNRSGFIKSDAELNFSGLDIPINLKYKVMDKNQSGLFLITGLSSMVYLNQQTTETLSVNSYFTTTLSGDVEFQPSVQAFTHEAGPEKSSEGVDFARMLNLSIGYEYNLKNGTFLSIEPYYKLPLGNMTFADQQFSIGGLHLRMNFQIGK